MEYNDIHSDDDGRHPKEKCKEEAAAAGHTSVCFKMTGGAFPPKMCFLQDGNACQLRKFQFSRHIFAKPENIKLVY